MSSTDSAPPAHLPLGFIIAIAAAGGIIFILVATIQIMQMRRSHLRQGSPELGTGKLEPTLVQVSESPPTIPSLARLASDSTLVRGDTRGYRTRSQIEEEEFHVVAPRDWPTAANAASATPTVRSADAVTFSGPPHPRAAIPSLLQRFSSTSSNESGRGIYPTPAAVMATAHPAWPSDDSGRTRVEEICPSPVVEGRYPPLASSTSVDDVRVPPSPADMNGMRSPPPAWLLPSPPPSYGLH